ncbi:MAG: DUF4870 domain-containing protein [Candidatus Pacearchaeota archaeon]
MKKGSDDKKLFAFLGVFLTVIGFIIALAVKRNDKYVMYYGKQGLILFIAWIIAWVASMIFAFIPVLGWIIMLILYLGLFVLWIVGIVYSLSGEMKPIPLIGQYADKIKV